MAKRPDRSELEEGAILHDRIAAHYRSLAELEREIAGRIERTDIFAAPVVDTARSHEMACLAQCLSSLMAAHQSEVQQDVVPAAVLSVLN
jgi:hypothetical protein